MGSNLCSLAAAAPPQQSPHRSPAISHRSASASELQSPPNARSRRQSELTHWRQRLLSARLHSIHHGGRRRDAHPRLGAECGGCLVDRHSGMRQLLAGWRESKPAGLPSAVRRTRRTSRFGWLWLPSPPALHFNHLPSLMASAPLLPSAGRLRRPADLVSVPKPRVVCLCPAQPPACTCSSRAWQRACLLTLPSLITRPPACLACLWFFFVYYMLA